MAENPIQFVLNSNEFITPEETNRRGPRKVWQLDVSCLSKTTQTIHGNGIPFALILTISDPNGEAPVNAELKYNIQQSNLIIENIQTAARVAPRV